MSSPYINHFLQPDTLIPDPSNPQAWNRYSYVGNNPVNFNDPTGHSASCSSMEDDCHHVPVTSPAPDKNGGGVNPHDDDVPDDDGIITGKNENNGGDYWWNDGTVDDWWNVPGNPDPHYCNNLLNSQECLDRLAIITQDIATAFSVTGAVVTIASTLIGCALAGEVGFLLGCYGGYLIGVGIHVSIFNYGESVFSGLSFLATAQSDFITGDTDLSAFEFGEDTKTSFATMVSGTLITNPFFDAGVDIYSSGYNHGLFCGISTILGCL